MSSTDQLPNFHTLLTKSNEELIQILAYHRGIRIPKDDYYTQSVTKTDFYDFINIIGRKFLIQIVNSYILNITLIRPEDNILIDEIKKGNHVEIQRNNPYGPSIIDLISPSLFNYIYYINNKHITEHQFATHRAKMRIQAIK